MPPLTHPPPPNPRIICYHQTLHQPSGTPVSLLPLLTNDTGITHLILAAIHLNDQPGSIHINNDPPSSPKYASLWFELSMLQHAGVKVLGMLGGAAKGTFARLDTGHSSSSSTAPSSSSAAAAAAASFEAYYTPLRDMIHSHHLNGLDLDVEEEMSLAGIIHLIDRLRSDFGPAFLITLAPVAAALMGPGGGLGNLSGFDYEALEVLRGPDVAWYNAQFYCGWGSVADTSAYDLIVGYGWSPEKVVVGLVTCPGNGEGWVREEVLERVLGKLRGRYTGFGGVMGWEYWNSQPGGTERPWEWCGFMKRVMGTGKGVGELG
ncbi:MAG: hypothetical protein M1827_000310 [Pycnora praestabilis]|nr:MAG: hypothetical protein M1827_000310 [Pycnora praestabilis]